MDVIFVTFVIAANLALPILVTGLVNHTIKNSWQYREHGLLYALKRHWLYALTTIAVWVFFLTQIAESLRDFYS